MSLVSGEMSDGWVEFHRDATASPDVETPKPYFSTDDIMAVVDKVQRKAPEVTIQHTLPKVSGAILPERM